MKASQPWPLPQANQRPDEVVSCGAGRRQLHRRGRRAAAAAAGASMERELGTSKLYRRLVCRSSRPFQPTCSTCTQSRRGPFPTPAPRGTASAERELGIPLSCCLPFRCTPFARLTQWLLGRMRPFLNSKSRRADKSARARVRRPRRFSPLLRGRDRCALADVQPCPKAHPTQRSGWPPTLAPRIFRPLLRRRISQSSRSRANKEECLIQRTPWPLN